MLSTISAPFKYTINLLKKYKKPLLYTSGTIASIGIGYAYYLYKDNVIEIINQIKKVKQLETELKEKEDNNQRAVLLEKLNQPLDASTMITKSYIDDIKKELNNIFDVITIRKQLKKGTRSEDELLCGRNCKLQL